MRRTPRGPPRPPASSSGPLARTARQPQWRAKSPAGEPFRQWFGLKVEEETPKNRFARSWTTQPDGHRASEEKAGHEQSEDSFVLAP
jgi:hypothetical protein